MEKKPTVKKPAKKPVTPRKPKAKLEPKKEKEEVKEVVKAEEIAPVAAPAKTIAPPTKNIYAVGKRKTAVTQILMGPGHGNIVINSVPFATYFQTEELRNISTIPLTLVGLKDTDIKAKVQGGGIHAQAESFRHAVSRAIIQLNPESRRMLKKHGFLTRDPRVKERKKPGLKRARRAPQFSKR